MTAAKVNTTIFTINQFDDLNALVIYGLHWNFVRQYSSYGQSYSNCVPRKLGPVGTRTDLEFESVPEVQCGCFAAWLHPFEVNHIGDVPNYVLLMARGR